MTRFPMFAAILRGSLLERRGRVLLAVAAIAIGTSVAAALLLVSRDVGSKVAKELRVYGPNAMLAPSAGAQAMGARDLALAGIGRGDALGEPARQWLTAERAAGRISSFVTLRYGVARHGDRAIPLAATDPGDLRALYPGWKFVGPADADAVLGVDAAKLLGAVPGGAISLDVADGAGTRSVRFSRVAIVSTGGGEDRVAFVSRTRLAAEAGQNAAPFALALARVEGSSNAVLAYADRPLPPGIGAGVSLRAIRQLSAADGDVLARLKRLLLTVTAVALLAAVLCAMSTLADLVLERTREVALLRSLGAARGDVLLLFATEAVVIGMLGGIVGLAIGIVAAQAIGRGVFGTAIAVAAGAIPATLLLGVLTALVASVGPVQRALAIEPAQTLRGE
ncbi:MAG: FtsX-like permease family protein [Candidatus Eisenbacteria bacterium]